MLGLGQTSAQCPTLLALSVGLVMGAVGAMLICETRGVKRTRKASVEAFARGWMRGEPLPKTKRKAA
jgi:hypothetical protein